MAVFTVRLNYRKTIDSCNRAQRSVQVLPATCMIGSVVDQKKRLVLTDACEAARKSFQGCLRSLRFLDRCPLVVTIEVTNLSCLFDDSPSRFHLFGTLFAIRYQEQSTTRLRHTNR